MMDRGDIPGSILVLLQLNPDVQRLIAECQSRGSRESPWGKNAVDAKDSKKRHKPATTCFIVDGSNLPTKYQNAGEVATENKVTDDDVMKIEVELKEATMQTDDQISTILVGPMPNPDLSPTPEVNATYPGGVAEPGEVVVRAEEALIVILVLVLWVAAIALFFNRWGKIRMLEPYQPKFQQQHRQSCAMIDPNPLQHRACSKFNIHCLEHPIVYPTGYGSNLSSRPRQNSVFVGSSMSLLPPQNAPRRAKSAFDIQTLVLAECTVQNTGDCDVPKRGRDSGKSFGESLRIPEFPRASSSVQRQRGMSICHFDRTDVLARPLMRERGMSICQFDRGDSLGKPPQRERGMSICQFDKQMPSCSKTPDVVHTYRATCV